MCFDVNFLSCLRVPWASWIHSFMSFTNLEKFHVIISPVCFSAHFFLSFSGSDNSTFITLPLSHLSLVLYLFFQFFFFIVQGGQSLLIFFSTYWLFSFNLASESIQWGLCSYCHLLDIFTFLKHFIIFAFKFFLDTYNTYAISLLVNTGVLVSCEVKFSWFFIFQVILHYILDIFNIVLLDLGSFLNPVKCYFCFSRQSTLLNSALSAHTAVGVSFRGLGWHLYSRDHRGWAACLWRSWASDGAGGEGVSRDSGSWHVGMWMSESSGAGTSQICRGCPGAVSEADFLSGRSCWDPLPTGHWEPWKSLLFSLVPQVIFSTTLLKFLK